MPETTPTPFKVRFNLKNVYYSKISDTGTYATPVAIPGAVSLDLSANGDLQVFYADGVKYYIGQNNNGYSGSLEVAKIPEQMLKDIWGISETSDNVLKETINDKISSFALLYKVETDQGDEDYVFYCCTAKRPPLSGKTNEENKTISTQSIEIECTGNAAGLVKCSTQQATSTSTKAGWFSTVYIPA